MAEEVGFFYDPEAAGLVELTRVVQSGRPNKKVYSVTTAGEAHLRARLAKIPDEDRFRSDLLLRLFFGHELPPETLLGWVALRSRTHPRASR